MTGNARVLLCALLLVSGCAGLPRPPGFPNDARKIQKQKHIKTRMNAAVKSYLGAPYRMGGTTRKGIDCSALVMRIYESVDVKIPRSAEQQYGAGREVTQSELQFGDVLFFNTKKLAHRPCTCLWASTFPTADVPAFYGVTHSGMYVGDGRFVHAGSSGVTFASVEDEYWQSRLIGIRRFLEDFDDG